MNTWYRGIVYEISNTSAINTMPVNRWFLVR